MTPTSCQNSDEALLSCPIRFTPQQREEQARDNTIRRASEKQEFLLGVFPDHRFVRAMVKAAARVNAAGAKNLRVATKGRPRTMPYSQHRSERRVGVSASCNDVLHLLGHSIQSFLRSNSMRHRIMTLA